MADNWMLGETAALDDYIPTPPSNVLGNAAQGVKDWWTNQPSWLDRAQAENQRTAEAYQRGGMGEIARQLATDTTEAQDLASGFGGNIKGVKPPLAPGALATVSEYRPPFYSAVEQAVQGAKQNAAPGQQWAGFLRNQPGVKPEEVEALKLGKLFEQPGSVPKEAVLGEIAANKVNVGEVYKGGDRPTTFSVSSAGNLSGAPALRMDFATAAEANAELAMRQANHPTGYHSMAELPTAASRPKFEQYTLPGGENYREMLLTLPPSQQASARHARMTALEEKLRNAGDYDIPEVKSMRQEYKQLADEIRGDKTFQSSHYDEPNILAHVRYNDRVIDGKKTLFVEEVQSDWHQKGKKSGYAVDQEKLQEQYDAIIKQQREITRDKSLDRREANIEKYNQLERERQAVEQQQRNASHSVPDAPFKTTWPELAMKRIIREAAEKGYDKVAWTPGSVQAERYDLSKQISKVSYVNNYLNAWDHSGNKVMSRADIKPNDLADYIGKEAAQKLLDQTPKDYSRMSHVRRGDLSVTQSEHQYHVKNPDGREVAIGKGTVGSEGEALDYAERYLNKSADEINQKRQLAHDNLGPTRELSGLDLKVGGEGMKGFYDEILPATVNRLVKKHGGRVTQADMTAASAASPERVHTLDITPSLRAAAMKGFPLFTAGGIAATGIMGEMARQDEYR